MITHITKIIEEFQNKISGPAATSAAEYLFNIRSTMKSQKLTEELATIFHHVVTQLLFVSGHAQWDVQIAVAFLSIIVKLPDEADWGKLK